MRRQAHGTPRKGAASRAASSPPKSTTPKPARILHRRCQLGIMRGRPVGAIRQRGGGRPAEPAHRFRHAPEPAACRCGQGLLADTLPRSRTARGLDARSTPISRKASLTGSGTADSAAGSAAGVCVGGGILEGLRRGMHGTAAHAHAVRAPQAHGTPERASGCCAACVPCIQGHVCVCICMHECIRTCTCTCT
eukprot:356981-Chlamydomonas_euryale.AAC.9